VVRIIFSAATCLRGFLNRVNLLFFLTGEFIAAYISSGRFLFYIL
jgi:hypothetical protein